MKRIPVRDIHIKKSMSSNELVKELYDSGGFTAKKLATGVDILENMKKLNVDIDLVELNKIMDEIVADGLINKEKQGDKYSGVDHTVHLWRESGAAAARHQQRGLLSRTPRHVGDGSEQTRFGHQPFIRHDPEHRTDWQWQEHQLVFDPQNHKQTGH